MQLTKTQQKLLDQAKAKGGSYYVEAGGGRGPEGGRISYGARLRDALFALRDAGLVEITHAAHDNHTNRGYTVRCSSWDYRIL